ncbi:flagellar hook-associated protein FlgL [Thalassiella azotivora]
MAGMRVTHKTISMNALANMQQSLGSTQRLTDKLSSGREIQRPSDDPPGTVTALQIRGDVRAQKQYARNADDSLGWLNQADSALQTTSSTLRRAQDLVIQGINGSNGPDSREAIAIEIETLRDGLLQVANTTYLDRPVFGGTTGSPVAYTDTYDYEGTGQVSRTLAPGVTMRADTPGDTVFGDGATSVFALLDRIAADLRTDPSALPAGLNELKTFQSRAVNALSDVGARFNRTDQLRSGAESAALDLQTQLAGVENIDLPKTIMELQLQQVAYQASLGATAKVLQPTLLDFLR